MAAEGSKADVEAEMNKLEGEGWQDNTNGELIYKYIVRVWHGKVWHACTCESEPNPVTY